MKSLRTDESGIIPLIVGIGVAIASVFGLSYLFGGTDPIEFLKVLVVASLLFVFGIIALMGKFVMIPKPWGFLLGIGTIIGAIYLVYRGGF